MATRKTLSSRRYTELVEFLHARPKTEEVARTLEVKAIGIAEKCGFPHQYRSEGQEFPQGFFTYRPDDKGSIGAFLRKGSQLWGWRWSKITQSSHRWTRVI